MHKYSAFTIQSEPGKLLRVLQTDCGVSETHDPALSGPRPKIEKFQGLWDTGATGTVISKRVIDALGLKPKGKTRSFHADGSSIVDIYFINLYLPNRVAFSNVRVTEGKLSGTDLLIGMDVISRGDFSISNFNGQTTFTFRIPSHKETCFVKEGHESKKADEAKTALGGKLDMSKWKKPPRQSDPCPCGSGKIYKKCHGTPKKK